MPLTAGDCGFQLLRVLPVALYLVLLAINQKVMNALYGMYFYCLYVAIIYCILVSIRLQFNYSME